MEYNIANCCTEYHILNCQTQYIAQLLNHKIIVYTPLDKKFIVELPFNKIFVDKDIDNDEDEKNGKYDTSFEGNSLLLKSDNNIYTFIGKNIYTFRSLSKIVKYYSKVENMGCN